MNVIVIALLIAFAWGLSPIIHKSLLKKVDAKVILVISGVMYFACLMIFTYVYMSEIKAGVSKLDVKDIAMITITSILAGFVANFVYLHILQKHSSHVISALIYSSPMFTLVFAYWLLRERISFTGAIGVLLIVAGVVMLAFNKNS